MMKDEQRKQFAATCTQIRGLLNKVEEGAIITRDDLLLHRDQSAVEILKVMASSLLQIAAACDDLARAVDSLGEKKKEA